MENTKSRLIRKCLKMKRLQNRAFCNLWNYDGKGMESVLFSRAAEATLVLNHLVDEGIDERPVGIVDSSIHAVENLADILPMLWIDRGRQVVGGSIPNGFPTLHMRKYAERLSAMQLLHQHATTSVAKGHWQLSPVIIEEDETRKHLLGAELTIMGFCVEQGGQSGGIDLHGIDMSLAIVEQQPTEMGGLLLRQDSGVKGDR